MTQLIVPIAVGICIALDITLLIKRGSFDLFELACKVVCSNFLILYLSHKISVQYSLYAENPAFYTPVALINWGLVMAQLGLFAVAYLTRTPPKQRARGFRETVIPIICTLLPLFLIESAGWARQWDILLKIFKPFYIQPPTQWNLFSIVMITLGDIVIVLGITQLRRSFSIFTEVRVFIQTGIYRFIRHPIYAGESMSITGILFLAPSFFNITIAVVFVCLLRLRAFYEEQKIAAAIPEYTSYKQTTGAYFPKIFRV